MGKTDATDKEFKPFDVCTLRLNCSLLALTLLWLQDGFHELAYEPDGMKEKFVNECTDWIIKHA